MERARPPDAALLWEGGGVYGGAIDAGFDRAVEEFDLRAVRVTAPLNGFDPESPRLSDEGVELDVVGAAAAGRDRGGVGGGRREHDRP